MCYCGGDKRNIILFFLGVFSPAISECLKVIQSVDYFK